MKAPHIPHNKPRKRRTCKPTFRWLTNVSYDDLHRYRYQLNRVIQQHTATAEDTPKLKRLRLAIDRELVRRERVAALAREASR